MPMRENIYDTTIHRPALRIPSSTRVGSCQQSVILAYLLPVDLSA